MNGPRKAMDRKGRNLKTHSKVPGKSVSGRCWRQAIFWDQVQHFTGQAIPVLVWPGHADMGPKKRVSAWNLQPRDKRYHVHTCR